MRLNRVLNINNVKQEIVEERIALDLSAPGRAEFTVIENNTLSQNQIVTFDLGYSSQDKMQRWFIGLTEKIVKTGDKRLKVFCRELSSVLSNSLPLSLRHVDLNGVLKAINSMTGLNYSTPNKDYSTTKVANFYSLGTGYQAMTALETVFNIPDFMWQQQSGVIYVGSWADSRWSKIKNMILPENIFNQHGAQNTATVGAIPALRPGMRINGKRINLIEFAGNQMVIKWI